MAIYNVFANYFNFCNMPFLGGFSCCFSNFVPCVWGWQGFSLGNYNTPQFTPQYNFQSNNWWSQPIQSDTYNVDTFQRSTPAYGNNYAINSNSWNMNVTPSWSVSFNASSNPLSSSYYSGRSRSYYDTSNVSSSSPVRTYNTGQSSTNKSSGAKKSSAVSTHSVNTVSMSSLDLKGDIAGCNSVPTIAKQNAENLKTLDKILTDWGYDVTYTSAMGGEHVKGSGHYKGNKVDIQLKKDGKNARLTSEQLAYLKKEGFWGTGTGAVGWEAHSNQVGGGHYDLCIA